MKNFLLTFLAVVAGMTVVIFGYEKYKANETRQYINVAYIVQGMASATPYKMLVREFWADSGKLPCSNEDLQIEAGTMGGHQALDAIELTGCGQITLTYNELSGVAGGTLTLEATEVKNATDHSLEWACHTESFEHISKLVPQCQPRPAGPPAPSAARTEHKTAKKTTAPQVAVAVEQPLCRDDALLYRSVFSDAIDNRTPQNRIVTIGPNRDKVFFFTEIIGAGGTEVSHHWYHNEAEVAVVPFEVKADRWRTWSSKRLEVLGPGTIRVEVKEGDCLIDAESILIADQEEIDPAGIMGWKKPKQAFETYLARQAKLVASASDDRSDVVDDLTENGDTRLLAAIRSGDNDLALNLIRHIDYQTIDGWERMPEDEILLYHSQANPFLRDANGISPISLAHQLGNMEIVEALIETITDVPETRGRRHYNAGPDVGKWGDSTIHVLAKLKGGFVRFDDGDTPLMRAVRTDNEQAVATMLRLGVTQPKSGPLQPLVDLYAHDAGGRQPLDIARDKGLYAIERFLLIALKHRAPAWAVSRATFTTEIVDSEPVVCRHTATKNDPVVYFFSELTDMEGAKIRHEWMFNDEVVQSNEFEIKTQRWSVQSSREFGPDDIGKWAVRVITDSGARLNTTRLTYKDVTRQIERHPDMYLGKKCDQVGFHALFELIRAHGPVRKIQYLIDKGTEWHPKSSQGKKLFAQMIREGDITLTRWFLKHGFDIESHPEGQMTPLMIAAKQGDVPMTLYLIKSGADVNKLRYKDHYTALQVAAYRNKADVVKVLIENGADPNLPNKRGVTALGRAIATCNMNATLTLLEHGGDPNIADKKGVRPRDRVDVCLRQAHWSAEQPEIAAMLNQDS